jgi:homoserine kinase
MTQPNSSVTVRVPGSTSNCGAGFDTLGLALQVHNRVKLVREDGDTPRPALSGDGRAQAMVETTAAAFSPRRVFVPSAFRIRFLATFLLRVDLVPALP